jgi:hypothetical protein
MDGNVKIKEEVFMAKLEMLTKMEKCEDKNT